ncbi:flagellar basal body-associated FliL family protein [Thermanaeromonas toyohensis]|uniref:flagellar basal body-associated FliL family protein n=1 Tax=Thermanaeromonas toyohensis TaxID=161154 RepID=UPI001561807D|nr:flagellar basal body-associated FliL family protein [Thermanaeromonas toyohensis]
MFSWACVFLLAGCSSHAEKKGPYVTELGPIATNVAEEKRYVRVTLVLETGNEPLPETEVPRIRDAVISLLRRKSAVELADTATLKQELLEVVRRAVGGRVYVQGVYFRELIVQ